MGLLALWNPNIQFLKTDGTINAGGKILVTYHNDAESIPANYSDADGTTLNSSPIVLDALGRATCYIDDGSNYDLYVKDANGATLWTVTKMTTGTETIVVSGGFSVSSNDRSVAVTFSVNSDGVTNYDLSIQKEIDRATEAEKGLADAIEAEKKRAEGAESTLSESIADETERAVAAEKASRTEIVAGDNITVDKTTGKDGHDIYTINGEKCAATANPLMDGTAAVGVSVKYAREDHVHPSDTSREDITNKTTVVLGTSDSKYPTDKAVAEFVNSSIATNTANYISNNGEPFTSVEQLEAYSGPVTNNDYAFVTGTDSEGNTYYDRYKATVSGSTVTWALESRLNYSSFTAAQWSAINSGITSVLVAKIHEHSNKDVLDRITSDKVNSWDGKEDAFEVLPTTKGGTGTNAASKSALTSTLINSLSSETSTPKDADYYVSQFAGGGTTKTTYHRRPVSALWEYIKNKISSVLGLTSSSYSGKAATAGTADKAVADKSGNNIETTYATKSETEEAISNSVDQTYSSTSTKAQSGVAVNEAFETRETSGSGDSYNYLGMSKPYGSQEVLYWKLVSFNAVSNHWTLQFEVDVSNGRKGDASYDTEIYETKRLTICGSKPGIVNYAKELRYAAQGVDSNRGYGNNIYYEISSSNLVTVYIKAIDRPNQTQLCRLKDVINFYGISNITWHKATNDAGTQPTNPVKFKELFPAIASTSSNIGSDSVPVYINSGKPVSCNSSNLKAGKDDDGNVIKNTYQKKLTFDTTPTAGSTNPVTSGGIKTAIDTVNAKGIVINEIDGENVICFE